MAKVIQKAINTGGQSCDSVTLVKNTYVLECYGVSQTCAPEGYFEELLGGTEKVGTVF